MVSHYRELKVWQKGMELVTLVYKVTTGFPKEEMYGLTAQIRRSVVSLPSNIAEGAARDTTRDFLRFISITHGSLAELETQLLIAGNLGFLNTDKLSPLEQMMSEIGRMLNGLQRSLQEKLVTDHSPLVTPL
jgi:four helix bundle protein